MGEAVSDGTAISQNDQEKASTRVSTSAWQVTPCVWTRGRPVCGAVVHGGHPSSEPHPDDLCGVPLRPSGSETLALTFLL